MCCEDRLAIEAGSLKLETICVCTSAVVFAAELALNLLAHPLLEFFTDAWFVKARIDFLACIRWRSRTMGLLVRLI
jgi:hypothetical protein